ncbi:hypothetical protein [Sulfuracidifex metallicus]|uniref:hypothetical protein n=1 Tax=Sulfuracidifex metallicus TaxID=47303 RepID=UPI0022752AB1|nr:hypothetical protein [Sulfuracidifex metallicus]MCY0849680.1 hypothetical protein [Sulfuracidifex metallicus]
MAMYKKIEPWGVNVPFIYLSIFYWVIGAISLLIPQVHNQHPYFMMIGSYSLFFGMIQKLFFPAKRYLPLQVAVLVFATIPIYYSQVFASLFLFIEEIVALKDITSYGGRFPINLMVLSSPPLSVIGWIMYPDFRVLIVPLLMYVMGVNIGVFRATMGTRVIMGVKQIPLMVLVLMVGVIPYLFTIVGVLYSLALINSKVKFNLSALTTLLSVSIVPLFSLHHEIHAFTLGVMSPLFFSCITYSLIRKRYDRVLPMSLLSALSFFLRPLFLLPSGVPWLIAVIIFLLTIKDRLGVKDIKG